jgi:hypothetical protein
MGTMCFAMPVKTATETMPAKIGTKLALRVKPSKAL